MRVLIPVSLALFALCPGNGQQLALPCGPTLKWTSVGHSLCAIQPGDEGAEACDSGIIRLWEKTPRRHIAHDHPLRQSASFHIMPILTRDLTCLSHHPQTEPTPQGSSTQQTYLKIPRKERTGLVRRHHINACAPSLACRSSCASLRVLPAFLPLAEAPRRPHYLKPETLSHSPRNVLSALIII